MTVGLGDEDEEQENLDRLEVIIDEHLSEIKALITIDPINTPDRVKELISNILELDGDRLVVDSYSSLDTLGFFTLITAKFPSIKAPFDNSGLNEHDILRYVLGLIAEKQGVEIGNGGGWDPDISGSFWGDNEQLFVPDGALKSLGLLDGLATKWTDRAEVTLTRRSSERSS
jgi:hypothetical protein